MTSSRTYRKKPVEIQAIQFTGTGESCTEVTDFLGGSNSGNQRWNSTTNTGGVIVTLEGEMTFRPGDWIIRGVKDEYYPCKPDIFEATYEPVPVWSMIECNGAIVAGGHVAHSSPCPLHPEAPVAPAANQPGGEAS